MPRTQTKRRLSVVDIATLETQFVQMWVDRHGPRLSGERLWRGLGFGSQRGFHRAVQTGWKKVALSTLSEGKGRWAKTEDVARFVWKEIRVSRLGGAP